MKKVPKVSLGKQLSLSQTVRQLDLKCNWQDYTRRERELLLGAEKIYFPTLFYCHVFFAMGKEIFPSLASYNLIGNKIRQTCLFNTLGVPHPKTRFFFGSGREKKILSMFQFPFIGKIPEASSLGRGVFFIDSPRALSGYLKRVHTAYIQEYLPIDRDIRVVVIGRRVVLSYWKIARAGEFRSNVARGSHISFEDVPDEALMLARDIAENSGIDHAGFDICMTENGPMVFEANIHFGTEGFRACGLSYKEVIAEMADSGEI